MTEGRVGVALVTAPSAAVAEMLVRTIVEERLAACGNIVPGIISIYRWDGAVQRDEEVLIIFKMAMSAAAAFVGRVRELHPYDVPEVVVLQPTDVLPAYARWVLDSVTAGADG
jgi:periplasmic divalent cation tolerance protein